MIEEEAVVVDTTAETPDEVIDKPTRGKKAKAEAEADTAPIGLLEAIQGVLGPVGESQVVDRAWRPASGQMETLQVPLALSAGNKAAALRGVTFAHDSSLDPGLALNRLGSMARDAGESLVRTAADWGDFHPRKAVYVLVWVE